MILGVCEQLERNTGINAWIWRLLFIFFGCSGTGILIYIILSFIL